MAIKTYTKIQETGLAENGDQRGMMEYGYGHYVNAYVVDTEFQIDEVEGCEEMGLYATERVPFDASDERISKARKLARQRARRRYQREKASI